MQSQNLLKPALLALGITAVFLLSWELSWRSKGFGPTFNDDKALWAEKRAAVYQPRNKATVFIGSSRIKFDLDIPTWRQLTGEDAVQLSLVGTSPLKVLKDLAEDPDFAGKLVIDVTEPLFFSQNPAFHKSALEAIAYYKKQTPSEKISSRINFALESQITVLEENKFSLNTMLNDLEIPNRPGVFTMPPFPKGFEMTTYDRQTYMSDVFLNDSNDVNRQTAIWTKLISGDPTPPLSGEPLVKVFEEIRDYVDQIRKKGGRVLFVRTPSSGPMGDGEAMFFGRDKYWEPMLKMASAEGIHFKDDPVTSAMICPEWSHLSPQDAVVYTKQLINSLVAKQWF